MTKFSLVDFLTSYVKPFLEYKWKNHVFLILEGGPLLIETKEDIAILMQKYSDFGARIWSIDDMLKHISNNQNTNLTTEFEMTAKSFIKHFGELDESKIVVLLRVYASMIWNVLLNKDSFEKIDSIINLKDDKYEIISVEFTGVLKYLSQIVPNVMSVIANFSSDWPIDADSSLRESFIKIFSIDETIKQNPVHRLFNWERKLLLLSIKNNWLSENDFDFELIKSVIDKSKEFVLKNCNFKGIFEAKKYIDTLWTEKSSLSLLKNTVL